MRVLFLLFLAFSGCGPELVLEETMHIQPESGGTSSGSASGASGASDSQPPHSSHSEPTSSTSPPPSPTSKIPTSGNGNSDSHFPPPPKTSPRAKSVKVLAGEEKIYEVYKNFKGKDVAELVRMIKHLSGYLGLKDRQEKFYPLFINIFKEYAEKLNTASFKSTIDSNWPEPPESPDNYYWWIVEVKNGNYQFTYIDAVNGRVIPLILKVLSEVFPGKQLFGRTTAFQQLLKFTPKDPTTAQIKEQMVKDLRANKDKMQKRNFSSMF